MLVNEDDTLYHALLGTDGGTIPGARRDLVAASVASLTSSYDRATLLGGGLGKGQESEAGRSRTSDTQTHAET